MQQVGVRKGRLLVMALCMGLLTSPACADRPDHAGGGSSGQHERKDNGHAGKGRVGHDRERVVRAHDDGGASVTIRFGDRQRTVIREYFAREVSVGRCPPGLAKKGSGCMPPGQAKKWSLGRPLPRDVVYYELPPSIVVELGIPPAGHKFVRVAGDILMIAIGTGLVVDAIEDLGRL